LAGRAQVAGGHPRRGRIGTPARRNSRARVLASTSNRAVARTRDRLVHHYFDIDLDVLWATVTEDLPMLLSALSDLDA
jgi:hypothetical protein